MKIRILHRQTINMTKKKTLNEYRREKKWKATKKRKP